MKTWQILVALSVAAMFNMSSADDTCTPHACPVECPSVYQLVCGIDRRTNETRQFTSRCLMQQYNCNHIGCTVFEVYPGGICP